jgi:hypothetical protein
MTVTVLGGVLVTGSNVQVLDTAQGRTVTVRELAGKLNWGVNSVRARKRVAVFFPDWTMNADGFVS